jgi:hypothetical protein
MEIASEIGVNQATLWRWRREPEFQQRVEQLRDTISSSIIRNAITEKDERLRAANERWLDLRRLVDSRAEHGRRHLPNVPGASTGLLIPVKRSGRDVSYQLDGALLRELRELERQVAMELGETVGADPRHTSSEDRSA